MRGNFDRSGGEDGAQARDRGERRCASERRGNWILKHCQRQDGPRVLISLNGFCKREIEEEEMGGRRGCASESRGNWILKKSIFTWSSHPLILSSIFANLRGKNAFCNLRQIHSLCGLNLTNHPLLLSQTTLNGTRTIAATTLFCQIQIQKYKYKYKYKYKNTNTNTNTNANDPQWDSDYDCHHTTNTNTKIQIQIKLVDIWDFQLFFLYPC